MPRTNSDFDAVDAPAAARLRALGDDPSEEAIAANGLLFAQLHEREPYAGVRVRRDIAYGTHPRQRLNLFVAEPAPADPAPILVFAHGGGYVSGDKQLPGTPYYDNVALWAVRRGLVGITMNYRFAPEHQWPSGADDVAGVVEWIVANAGACGGDPRRLFLMGHSAGAAHVAAYIARGSRVPLAGAVLASGVYDIVHMERSANHRAYFGADAERYAERSSVDGVARSGVPLLVTSAEYEPRKFHPQAARLLDAVVERRGQMPPSVCLPGHTHFSPMFALNAGPSAVSSLLDAFVDGVLG